MSETRLLPCPFCGGEAELTGYYMKGVANNYQYYVRCKTCKARPQCRHTFKKPEKAIELWNARKPMERIVEKLQGKADDEIKYWEEFGDDDAIAAMNAYHNAVEIIREEGQI